MQRNRFKRILITAIWIVILFNLIGCERKEREKDNSVPKNSIEAEQSAQNDTDSNNDGKTAQEDTDLHHEVSIMTINVGKADSILIQIDDHNYLIDTGTDDTVPALLRALAIQDVEKLDGVFLTHTHKDHIGGLEGLTKKYDIPVLYSATISETKKNGKNKIDELAEELKLKQHKLSAGDFVTIDDKLAFEVIAPIVYNEEDDNDNSLVLRLSVNGKTFLFAGDMQFAEEQTLLDASVSLNCDVLKVGNHGNPDATSERFAKETAPEIALISTDRTKDKDSANERVLEALSDSDIYITENFTCGILIQMNDKNEFVVTNPSVKVIDTSVMITDISKDRQICTLTNQGPEVDISGYFLYSSKGSEVFVFPEGTVLKAGKSITISAKGGNGDFIWEEKNIWSKNHEDIGYLYDCNGNAISLRESN